MAFLLLKGPEAIYPSKVILEQLKNSATGPQKKIRGISFLKSGLDRIENPSKHSCANCWLLTDGSFESVKSPHWSKKCADHLADATNHLFGLTATSTIADMFKICIYDVVIFRSNTRNSFYHPDLPGVIFINIAQQENKNHLIEELVHQSGHAALDYISPNCSKFIASNTLVSYNAEHSHADLEHDSLTVRFHSLVTLTLICEAFHHSLSYVQRQQKHLLMGRLSFAFQKLSYDIQLFIKEMALLKDSGLILLRKSMELYQEILSLHQTSIDKCNFIDQPYYFEEAIFLRHN